MNLAELQTLIVEALGTELGLYTFVSPEGTQTTPAIRVDEGYCEEPTVTGLEVVLRPDTSVTVVSFLGGDRQIGGELTITLTQWDASKHTTRAREILSSVLEVEDVSITPSLGGLGNLEVCTLTISEAYYTFG